MNDKRKIKQEYIKMKSQEVPDLWERIESGLEERPEAADTPTQKHSVFFTLSKPFYGACALACMAAVYLSAAYLQGRAGAVGTAGLSKGKEAVEITKNLETAGKSIAVSTAAEAVPYESLSLARGIPLVLPDHVRIASQTQYFSESVLADTSILCKGQVKDVSFVYDDEGAATAILYEIGVEQILYSEDYAVSNVTLQVRSEISQAMVGEDSLLYALVPDRTYLLPLKSREDGFWLVFSSAPQIEVTDHQEYLFHNGWQSLVNQEASVVLNGQAAPEDIYYDRMYLRRDEGVVTEVVSLVEAMHEYGRKNYEEKKS